MIPPPLVYDMVEVTIKLLVALYNPSYSNVYLAEALEYITSWQQATEEDPVGICGPIGPTEQLPLVARMVNELNINLKS